ncbi:MAG: glycosyltransferase [Acidimicrobiia bacterium]|nr:glycosyltransferase [Acidimicrobiia bacterium]
MINVSHLGMFFLIAARGAMAKAWAAVRENRLPLSPRWWRQALVLHWREARAAGSGGTSYDQWLTHHQPASGDVRGPHISVAALVDEPAHVDALIDSVIQQSFEDWDLWIVPVRWRDDYERIIERRPKDLRVRLVRTWVPPAGGGSVVLLDPHSLLAPGALARVSQTAQREPDAWIYTDDDLLDNDGRRSDPYFKGEFSPELALVDDYATRLAVAPRPAITQAGGLRPAYGTAQIYDLFLRMIESGVRVVHLAEVCCHRRAPVPAVFSEEHRQAAGESLARRGVPAAVVAGPRVQWRQADATGGVTIVIPTRDRVDLLRACIASLRQTVDMSRISLLIVDDRSQEAATADFLSEVERTIDRCRVLRPPAAGDAFSYSRLMNLAAREVETPLMLHLNNDVEATTPGWLDQMQGWLALPGVGVVGPKLLYPDGSIQHAGVMVMPGVFTPAHMFHRLPDDNPGYQRLPHRVRNVSAVTGACLLTRTALYREVGGFDEAHLPVQFNDVDYCLRVAARGERIVYEPAAVLRHRAGESRAGRHDYRETMSFLARYRDFADPYISPHVEPLSMLGAAPVLKTRGRAPLETSRANSRQ